MGTAWGDPPYPDGAPGDGAAPGPTTPTSWLTIPAPSRPSSGCAPETWCSTATQAVGFTPTPSASPNAKPQAIHRDVFRGTVTAINETQLTVRNMNGESKTFVRTDKTQVVRGRNEPASWSAIEVNSHVRVRFEARNGKLYAARIHLGRAHVAGKVVAVNGNVITITNKDGKSVKLNVTGETRYFEGRKANRKPGTLKDIQAGDRLIATGKWDVNGSFDATLVVTLGPNAR